MSIKEKVNQLGYQLPLLSKPGGNYVSVNIRANIVYVAIQFPKNGDQWIYKGRIGDKLTNEDAYKAMELCALNVLTHIDHTIGFDNLIGMNHMDAYFQASENWDDSPKIVDGVSDLFIKVLGEKGNHSIAIFGVDKIPRNFAVGITCSFTINN